MKIPFARPDITEEEISAVVETLRNGWVTSGPKMKEFETALVKDYGLEHETQAIALNSATAGLHLALEALGIGHGDEVLVPTLTFTATAEVVRYVGAIPVFVDIDPNTLNIDIVDAARKITNRTIAIMPVHFAGLPCNMDDILTVARDHHLYVIEDAAHALGSKYKGVPVGMLGSDVTVFSFYATKCITTGEGGALLTKIPNVANRARTMRLHGIDRDAFSRYNSDVPAWEYDIIAAGYKYNMTDSAAAMGLIQLQRSQSMLERRTNTAHRYIDALKDLVKLPPIPSESGTQHSFHLFPVQVPNRNNFITKMYDMGVGCSVHFKPLHRMSYWQDGKSYPHADKYFEHCVSLPIYSGMSDDEVSYVIDCVKKAL